MKVSVVVTTYNGEKYVREQLYSILNQTRQADEVIISDDHSTDDSVKIIQNFILEHDLREKWYLNVNDYNLGLYANAYIATSMSTGDVFLWSDQDDVWLPRKIEKMVACVEQDPRIQAISCQYKMVDTSLQKLNHTFKIRHETGIVQKRDMPYVFTCRNTAAQSLAVRKSLYNEMVRKFIIPKYLFDYAIITYASAIGGYFTLDWTGTLYRQHHNNLSAKIITPIQLFNQAYNRLGAINKQIEMMEIKKYILNGLISDNEYALIVQAVENNRKRANLFKSKNIRGLIKLLFTDNTYINKKWIYADIIALLGHYKQ